MQKPAKIEHPEGEETRTAQLALAGEPVAEFKAVTKRYDSIEALNKLSIELRRREVVAFLGPNGAGKTTAVRILLGLTPATSGKVRIFGGAPGEFAARSRTGAMLQGARVSDSLKVREHIDLFRSYYPHPLSTPDVIRIAMLEDIENRKVGQLSGGQMQRLSFALSICGDPELVLLDEPTAGLDVEARRGLWAQIRGLKSAGKTVLLTTHYLEEADALADRILVINKGRIVSEGTPEQIKAKGGSWTLRCRTHLVPEILRSIPTVCGVDFDGTAVTLRAGNTDEVVRLMLELDPSLSELEIARPSLEEAFLGLTDARQETLSA